MKNDPCRSVARFDPMLRGLAAALCLAAILIASALSCAQAAVPVVGDGITTATKDSQDLVLTLGGTDPDSDPVTARVTHKKRHNMPT